MKTISVKDLNYSIQGPGPILSDVSFEAYPGEFIGILGKNGEGKSTLLDLLMGFSTPQSGSILVLDEDPFNDGRANKQFVSYISQDIEVTGNLTVTQFFQFHASFYPQYNKKMEEELSDLFEIKKDVKISTLSTGLQRRLQVVSGLSSLPHLILIDEITAVLDPKARSLLFNYLKEYQDKTNATILMATNVVEDLRGIAHRILCLENTKMKEVSPQEIDELFNLAKVS